MSDAESEHKTTAILGVVDVDGDIVWGDTPSVMRKPPPLEPIANGGGMVLLARGLDRFRIDDARERASHKLAACQPEIDRSNAERRDQFRLDSDCEDLSRHA